MRDPSELHDLTPPNVLVVDLPPLDFREGFMATNSAPTGGAASCGWSRDNPPRT